MFAQLAMDIPATCVCPFEAKKHQKAQITALPSPIKGDMVRWWTVEFEFTEGSGIPDTQHS